MKMRKGYIAYTIRPPDHGRESCGFFTPINSVVCDNPACGRAIHTGSACYAVSTWRTEGYRPEVEPELWEKKFGELTYNLPKAEPEYDL